MQQTTRSAFGRSSATIALIAVVCASCLVLQEGCASRGSTTAGPEPVAAMERLEVPGCENVIRVGLRLISGGQPKGEEAFAGLAELGVRTVINVDGARPDLESAHGHGLRYVHLPIGYDGIPEERALEIARAVRDLDAPIYLHCHHGRHRGPAAAAIALIAVEGWTGEEAVAFMEMAETSPKYVGLYRAVRTYAPPTRARLDAADDSFPAVAELPDLVEAMALIDRRLDNIGFAKATGWRVPPDHPDVDPPHEALQLRELFAEINRDPEIREESDDYRGRMRDAERAAADLEKALRAGEGDAATDAHLRLADSCDDCHASYRNR